MKWRHEPEPRDGQVREREGFLFLPKRVGLETRWLVRAAWAEEFVYCYLNTWPRWRPTWWLS